jgi:hypothetical protein
MGLNITPYDNDNTAAEGTSELRHIDQSTRLGWSAFGSVQSDPYRWGLATLPGYTPPAGQPTEAPDPILGHTNLSGTDSPQTIWQSARNGVPIAGRTPAGPGDSIHRISHVSVRGDRVGLDLVSGGSGTAHVFAWSGTVGYIPVYTTSCSKQADPPPDYGMTACAISDGGIPPWSPDMSGHVLGDSIVQVSPGRRHVSISLGPSEARQFRRDGRILVSFLGDDGGVQALDVRPHR